MPIGVRSLLSKCMYLIVRDVLYLAPGFSMSMHMFGNIIIILNMLVDGL